MKNGVKMPCSPHGAGPVEQTANNVVNKKRLLYRVQMAKFNEINLFI